MKPDWPIERFHRLRCSRRAQNRIRQTIPHTWRNDRLIDWKLLPDRMPVVTSKGVTVYLGLCPRHKP